MHKSSYCGTKAHIKVGHAQMEGDAIQFSTERRLTNAKLNVPVDNVSVCVDKLGKFQLSEKLNI